MKEIWKMIEGYPNHQISNKGNIKSLRNTGKWEPLAYKVIYNKKGVPYNFAMLNHNGSMKNTSIAKLVATHFISEQPADDSVVDHINEITTDNHVENLQWVSWKQNIQRAVSKPFNATNLETGEVTLCIAKREAAELIGCSERTICRTMDDGLDTAVGRKWKFEYINKTAKDIIDNQ